MLLRNVELTYVSPCLADPEKIRLKAQLSDDVTEIMPYLNTVLKGAIYNNYAPNISFYKEFRLITLYPREMTMIKALNTTDAWQIIEWLKDLINSTYERRREIEPSYERKRRPHPLQLFQWLPQTNCRQCGEYSCIAFAVLLFSGQQKLKRCTPLFTEKYREHREVLAEVASALGTEEELSSNLS